MVRFNVWTDINDNQQVLRSSWICSTNAYKETLVSISYHLIEILSYKVNLISLCLGNGTYSRACVLCPWLDTIRVKRWPLVNVTQHDQLGQAEKCYQKSFLNTEIRCTTYSGNCNIACLSHRCRR